MRSERKRTSERSSELTIKSVPFEELSERRSKLLSDIIIRENDNTIKRKEDYNTVNYRK